MATGTAEGLRRRSEQREGAFDAFVDRWRARFARVGAFFARIFRGLGRLTLWLWKTVVASVYNIEYFLWSILNLLYDVLYYPLYAAWIVVLWALRVVNRVFWAVLKLLWKFPLRLATWLPGIRKWWSQTQRPKILAAWAYQKAQRKQRYAHRIERGRHLAELRGERPDRWEADFRRRRGFPMPLPERARRAIGRRLTHIRLAKRARREGKPAPKWRSEKARLKEQQGQQSPPTQ